MARKQWYQQSWGILGLLVVFFPVGLYLMFKYAKWSTQVKTWVTVGFAVLVIGIAMAPSPEEQAAMDEAKQVAKAAQDKTKAEEVAAKKAAEEELRQATIAEIGPTYCQNHKNFRMADTESQQFKNEGWPVFEGRRNWTADECRQIITKLYDSGSSKEQLTSIANSKIWVGMTFKQLIYSWGTPDDINSTAVAGAATSHQLVYGDIPAQYVYLENGVVTAWQN